MHTVVPSLTHDKIYHKPLCFIASDQSRIRWAIRLSSDAF